MAKRQRGPEIPLPTGRPWRRRMVFDDQGNPTQMLSGLLGKLTGPDATIGDLAIAIGKGLNTLQELKEARAAKRRKPQGMRVVSPDIPPPIVPPPEEEEDDEEDEDS